MQAFKATRYLRCAIAAATALFVATTVLAQGHQHHASMGSGPRTELGTGVAVDPKGRFWIAIKDTDGDAQYVALQRSDDDGKTWSTRKRIQAQPEAVAADGENRPKIAFGPNNEIYVTYTKPLAKPYTGEIRLVRSVDGGQTFSPPITVHANRDLITHRFESIIVDRTGRVYVAWIDKRDVEAAAAQKKPYRGAALYYAVSEDNGATFKGDFKVADHTCECCRIALALNPQGHPVALWRHVFEPNVRDHATVELVPDGHVQPLARASFDQWRIDACPHQGPGLAYAPDGTRHQVWFNVKNDAGGVFYAAASPTGRLGKATTLGSAQAEHADIAVSAADIVIVWKQFDGKSTAIRSRISNDAGRTWRDAELARTRRDSDQPHLVVTPSGILLAWRTQDEGMQLFNTRAERSS